MTSDKTVSSRELLLAVIAALIVGLFGLLAIRSSGDAVDDASVDQALGGIDQIRWRVTSAKRAWQA